MIADWSPESRVPESRAPERRALLGLKRSANSRLRGRNRYQPERKPRDQLTRAAHDLYTYILHGAAFAGSHVRGRASQ
jgi:hypothetical protein